MDMSPPLPDSTEQSQQPLPQCILAGPLLLLLGSVLAIVGLFLPWYYIQIESPCLSIPYGDCLASPVAPGFTPGAFDSLLWPIVVATLVIGFITLRLFVLPSFWRKRWSDVLSAWLGVLCIVATLAGVVLALITEYFVGIEDAPIVRIRDGGGYYTTIIGFGLILIGAVFLIKHVRDAGSAGINVAK